MAFRHNVFINCPFDEEFFPLLRPLLFTVIYLGLKPRIALESVDSGRARLAKIVDLIAQSKYAIHDISRIEAKKAGDLFRLNMPFELGLDFGCRAFGSASQRTKKCLILEAEPFRYKAALSDLSGSDIACHHNDSLRVVVEVRNWLKNVCGVEAPGPTKISGAFLDFMWQNYDALKLKGFSDRDVAALPVPELIAQMQTWVSSHR